MFGCSLTCKTGATHHSQCDEMIFLFTCWAYMYLSCALVSFSKVLLHGMNLYREIHIQYDLVFPFFGQNRMDNMIFCARIFRIKINCLECPIEIVKST